ncbi:hypothetical protein SLS58_008247 [Diplodia intermedia]|uniref:Uncharacterized protein n=1 Tax=Diplodia intermedia TaxID=856260 RepID=A0ABR3TIE1_9PEZI
MSAVAGTLGSVIGYLGAEVAETTLIERLLWPQRFYTYTSPSTILKLSFLMPMSGPLHRAALHALDAFRDRGLYRGACQGHMLGTAFYPDRGLSGYHRTARRAPDRECAHEVRNCLWVAALRCVDQAEPAAYARPTTTASTTTTDPEQGGGGSAQITRARQKLFTLHLDTRVSLQQQRESQAAATAAAAGAAKGSSGGGARGQPVVHVTEGAASVATFVGMVASELSTVLLAVAVAWWRRTFWLTAYLCVPLVLKLLGAWLAVRREPLQDAAAAVLATSADGGAERAARREMFEIISPDIGFVLVTAPSSDVVFQFFRHYGHPLRITRLDRVREVLSIALVYLFVIYFPAGLVSLLWMDEDTQYLWLGYQVYVIAAMHAGRLIGLNECATLEERIGKIFETEATVCLDAPSGSSIFARLEVETVKSVTKGRERVDELVREALETVV